MSNNKQPVELTEITVSSPVATQGLTMEERDASIGLLLDFAKRGRNRGERLPSICKVPSILRDLSVRSFNPQLVSIGPIHRENKKLKEFEWQKECYLDDLLNRCISMPEETLNAFLQKVNDLIPQIRESYGVAIRNYSDVELAMMMVKDGCFILEFCFKHEDEYLYLPNTMQNTRIAMDLMLLENQVPFSVLQALFECSMGKVSFNLSDVLDNYLAPYIKLFYLLPEKNSILSNVLDICLAPCIKLFCPLLPEKFLTTDVDADSTHDHVDSDSTPAHVLGYLHTRYQPAVAKSSNREKPEEKIVYHSIVELDRSGINFKPHQEDNCSMTIKFQSPLLPCLPWFWSKPTLLMPTLVIDDFTELILRNFIAYEQSFHQDYRYYFTSYAHAMDMLIDSKEDIAKLADSKVLFNTLGSNKEAADMINKICKNISITDFYYTEEFRKMDKYYSGCCRDHIAQLRRVYFSNPWSAIALFVGFIVFLATVVSAIFAILDYFR